MPYASEFDREDGTIQRWGGREGGTVRAARTPARPDDDGGGGRARRRGLDSLRESPRVIPGNRARIIT